MFTSLCVHTQRPDGDEAQFLTMPDVPGPAASSPMDTPFTDVVAGSFFDSLERRIARGRIGVTAIDDPQPEGHQRSLGHGSVRMWSEDGRLLGTAQQTCIVRTSHHNQKT